MKTRRSALFSLSLLSLSVVLLLSFFHLQSYAQSIEALHDLIWDKAENPKLSDELNGLIQELATGDRASFQGYVQTHRIQTEPGDRIQVVVHIEPGRSPRLLDAVPGVNVQTIYGNIVQISVPATGIEALSRLPGVSYITRPYYADLYVISEGVALTHADDEYHARNYKGSGVKIAVLDGGFSGYRSRQSAGELPQNITTINFNSSGFETSDHGTANAELVYDMAPEAQLYLVAFATNIEFLSAMERLVSEHVNIISASVGFRFGPFDGTGELSEKVNYARNNGIVYVTAAGNEAETHYMGYFAGSNEFHDFSPSDEVLEVYDANGNSLGKGEGLDACLSWNAWPTTDQDYDLLVVGFNQSTGNWEFSEALIPLSSRRVQNGDDEPIEIIQNTIPNDSSMDPYTKFGLAIHKYSANGTHKFHLNINSNVNMIETNHIVSASSIQNPGVASGAITTGAVDKGKYSVANYQIEYFSSRGPTDDGRIKPEICGPDRVSTVTYGTGGFGGTSAPVPQVAGGIALLMSADPSLKGNPNQVKTTLMSQHARDVGTPGVDNESGAGLMMLAAPTATVTITVTSPNGGETWGGGTSKNITWSTTGSGINHIRLLYSTDGGVNYPNTITASTPNDGVHSWVLPVINSGTVRVKAIAEDVSNNQLASDTSNGNFIIDSTAPVTSDSLVGTPGENGWYISDVTVTLTAVDSLSGVRETRYRVNAGTWLAYTVPFTITGSILEYYSTDRADNQEITKSKVMKIDKTDPSTPVVTDDGTTTTSTTQLHASWTSSDPESGIAEYWYAIGTAPGETNVVPWSSTGTATEVTATGLSLTAGQTYYFAVKAKNGAGRRSLVGTSDGITVSSPSVTITVTSPNGGETWGGGTSKNITWSTAGSGINHIRLLYSTDGGVNYPNTITVSTPNDGIHSWGLPVINSGAVRVKAIAEDVSNNQLASDTSNGNFIIDSTAPVTSDSLVGTPGENGWYISDVIVTLTAVDSLSGVRETRYRVNAGTWLAYTVPFTITGSTLEYYSTDRADNQEVIRSKVAKIDKTDPSTPVVTDDGTTTTSTTQLHASWTSSDPESGIAECWYAIGTAPGGTNVVNWTAVGTNNEVTATGLSLTVGQTYYFAVKSKNIAGRWSAVGASDGINVSTSPALLVSVPDRSGSPGSTVAIPVQIGNTTGLGIIGVDFKLTYDASILTARSVTTVGTIAEPWGAPTYNIGTPGQVIVTMASATPLAGSGVLLNISFDVSPAAVIGSTSSLTLAKVSLNEGSVPVNLRNGLFTVGGRYGDVTGDGGVTSYDAAWVLQYVAGLRDFTPQQRILADVSGNGGVSAYDAGLILQYAAGLITQFPVEGAQASVVSATIPVEVRVDDLTGRPGDRVTASVDVSDVTGLGIIGVCVEISYNASILTARSATTTGTVAGTWGEPTCNLSNTGRVIVAMAGSLALGGSGSLVKISFDISSAAIDGAVSNLVVFRILLNENGIPVVIRNGRLTVESSVSIPLPPGWKLVSFPINKCFYQGDPPADQPASVELVNISSLGYSALADWLSSVIAPDDAWQMVIGQNGAMDKTLPPTFHTLKYMSPCCGYWMKIDEGILGGAILTLRGVLFDPGSAIHLPAGWNLVGYPSLIGYYDTDSRPLIDVPEGTIWVKVEAPVARHVFESLEGKYNMIMGENGAYDPALPAAFSSLHYIAPGFAYWLNMNEEADLIYEP